MRVKTVGWMILAILILHTARGQAQQLFVGLEGSEPVTRSTDLAGFPDVSYDDHYAFDVSGAAATPDGLLFLCNGAFTTELFSATPETYPQYLSTISVDIHALAYGDNTLWGFSNYASPKGIYEIDPITGSAELALDVYTNTGFRFFGLDYNSADGLLYGYTEYGESGLYSINLVSGEMIKLIDTIPASNGQGRGLAVGNNTVYLTATRGDDQIPYFAYDLAQGVGGDWIAFTNPYPAYHSTGGAAWIPDPMAGTDTHPADPSRPQLILGPVSPNPVLGAATIRYQVPEAGTVRAGLFDLSGRRLRELDQGYRAGGAHLITWDGRDGTGHLLPGGVYLVRLDTAAGSESVLLRVLR